jgi:serine/threonine protein kinase
LGRGQFGAVYKVKDLQNREFALKEVHKKVYIDGEWDTAIRLKGYINVVFFLFFGLVRACILSNYLVNLKLMIMCIL